MTRHKRGRTRIPLSIKIFLGSMTATIAILMLIAGFHSSTASQKEQDQVIAPVVATTPVIAQTTYSTPVRLVIPKINIDTSIVEMGLTASGNMEAPLTNQDAGWYKDGPFPGNWGSAVIDGHRGLTNEKAVFTQLEQLEKGDTISVIDDRGQIALFIIRELRTYTKDTPAPEVFASTGGAHLNLITCNGDWESAQRTYSQRLVVFADKKL